MPFNVYCCNPVWVIIISVNKHNTDNSYQSGDMQAKAPEPTFGYTQKRRELLVKITPYCA